MNEKIDRILSIAAQNGVSLHKNFTKTYLSTHGFYEGPQQLAQSTLDEMERLCFKGMNAGFDGNLKGALDKLSGIVISLTAVKNGDLRELSKLDQLRPSRRYARHGTRIHFVVCGCDRHNYFSQQRGGNFFAARRKADKIYAGEQKEVCRVINYFD